MAQKRMNFAAAMEAHRLGRGAKHAFYELCRACPVRRFGGVDTQLGKWIDTFGERPVREMVAEALIDVGCASATANRNLSQIGPLQVSAATLAPPARLTRCRLQERLS